MVTSALPLKLEAATVQKRGRTLIGPISHNFEDSGVSIIIGPTGAGKTTFLKLMHGLEKPQDGQVTWNVEPGEARARQSFVFQTPIMLRRSVINNLVYPLQLRGISRRSAVEEANTWLKRINLEVNANLEAAWLSGGEKQKLAVTRALIVKPEILFLDEPTNNLDGKATREIESLLLEARDQGTRIIMATHDLGQAQRLADEVLFIWNGNLRESGSADTFFARPETAEARAFLKGDILE